MKTRFYPKLAWAGIVKNKKLYLPYLFTCVGMVMMYYILHFLAVSREVAAMHGGSTIQLMLRLGCMVMGVFSLFFLIYTNSFLMRRRRKEFGLYNILGMDKWNLMKILVWESLFTAMIALFGGLAFGILFSKFAELLMINILKEQITFSLSLEWDAIISTCRLFAMIFLLILFKALWQIRLTDPIELLHSENNGEKPPKANYLLALAGAVLLGAAYFIAVAIEDPVTALIWFFIAVLMVMAATYLLFIAGSVTICRLLQKSRRFYYQKSHFVSVSSMVYRMKRNGAGLASICILCTMVLVMVSSTVCLYIGTENSLRKRYSRDITIDIQAQEYEDIDSEKRELIYQAAKTAAVTMDNVLDYRAAVFVGLLQNGVIITDSSAIYEFQAGTYSDVWQIFVVALEDYNQLMGQEEALASDEVLLYTTKVGYQLPTVTVGNGEPLKVKKVLKEFVDNGVDAMQVIPSMFLIVQKPEEVTASLMELADARGNRLVYLHWYYGFDLDCDDDTQIQIQDQVVRLVNQLSIDGALAGLHITIEGMAGERVYFYAMNGGLFFLGILLGAVFIFAAVLMMYYKQISEGYEDQSRFAIMQKVGMTAEDIRKSIDSQMRMVFFLPLLAAGIHLAFAFPLIQKLLQLFAMMDIRLLVQVTVVCYLIFAVCYTLVYRAASRTYCALVTVRQD